MKLPKQQMQRPLSNAIRNSSWAVILASTVSLYAPPADLEARDSDPVPISVCDLFKNIAGYRNQLVTVRGVYWFGLRQSCKAPFITQGHSWPLALNLVGSTSASDSASVPFVTDDIAWDKLDLSAIALAKAGRKAELWVTVVGLLRAPASYFRGGAGGYGHLNVFPAELVIKTVRNIVTIQRPTYDYGRLIKTPKLNRN